jgi:RNA polymerase II subunit A-like phosphatase
MSIDDKIFLLKFRPFLMTFLFEISNYFEIFVYTFGTKKYATKILEILDSNQDILKLNRLIAREDNIADLKDLNNIIPQ